LVNLEHRVELVGTVLVTTHVVEVDPVGLSTFTGNNTDSSDIAAREFTGEELQRGCAEILRSLSAPSSCTFSQGMKKSTGVREPSAFMVM